jgi:hypothetical protein
MSHEEKGVTNSVRSEPLRTVPELLFEKKGLICLL